MGELLGILDDDESVRAAMDSLIKSAGYRTAVFESGEQLLNSALLHDVDCLVIDIQIRGIDGLELQRILTDMNHKAPIIVVSAHSEARTKALDQGAAAFIEKPFISEVLLDAIQSALNSPK